MRSWMYATRGSAMVARPQVHWTPLSPFFLCFQRPCRFAGPPMPGRNGRRLQTPRLMPWPRRSHRDCLRLSLVDLFSHALPAISLETGHG